MSPFESTRPKPIVRPRKRTLIAAMSLVGIAWLWLSFQILASYFAGSQSASNSVQTLVPHDSLNEWRAFPIQDGRIKPFETASAEIVRQITGRDHFAKTPPVAIVLSWWLSGATSGEPQFDWESFPFILCDHHDLRRVIYSEAIHMRDSSEPRSDYKVRLTGKYISPADLRASGGFETLLAEVAKQRESYQGRAHLYLSTAHLKAEEVVRRLTLFDSICGRRWTRLKTNAISKQGFLNVAELAETQALPIQDALRLWEDKITSTGDPLHCIELGDATADHWFSLPDLKILQQQPIVWRNSLKERIGQTPERFLTKAQRQTLEKFRQQVRAGEGGAIIDALADRIRSRRETLLGEFELAQAEGETAKINDVLTQCFESAALQQEIQQERERMTRASQTAKQNADNLRALVVQLLGKRDSQIIDRLRQGLAQLPIQSSVHDSLQFHALERAYLEAFYPRLYEEIVSHQEFPAEQIQEVLNQFAELQTAYQSRERKRFHEASQAFLKTVERGKSTTAAQATSRLNLELTFNQLRPFHWAWITMLGATLLLLISMGAEARGWFVGGLAFYLLSLSLQTVGFTLRIWIAGRAPVANMYETVVFVAYLAAIFAFLLELIYRRRVLLLAGSMVATLGLILADQLPLALDPKISPMLPVLRTNFWLTVHVLTIVASYAGGTLAWGLGNITLGIIAFGKGDRATLRTLSQFTYRAMQIAVLLLAAGTFLGGCWAAESWGRFWGWDPKEVGALVALVCYVIPLHARYIGWVRDFGLAVSAVLCYASIILSWYVINFLLAAGLHSYGFSSGGAAGVLWATLLNLQWVLATTFFYQAKSIARPPEPATAPA